MRIFLIVLLILIICVAFLWTYLSTKLYILYQKGNAGNLSNDIRIRSITFNMGKNKRTKDEWKNVIQYDRVSEKIRNWDIITEKDYDILFVALQESWNESSPYGQMGLAISEILNDFDCYTYSHEGPPNILRNPYSVQNWVFVRKNIVDGKPGVLKGKICHTGLSLLCTKATVGLALEFNNRKLIFMSSHLPFSERKKDLGYAERVDSMRSGIKLLEKLGPNNASVIWAGDLNFRSNDDFSAKKFDFEESSLSFQPTCKLLEQDEIMESLKLSRISAIDLRYSALTNPSQKVYNKERIPSYCDRVLFRNLTPIKYYSWNDGRAVDTSDHNVVVLDARLSLY